MYYYYYYCYHYYYYHYFHHYPYCYHRHQQSKVVYLTQSWRLSAGRDKIKEEMVQQPRQANGQHIFPHTIHTFHSTWPRGIQLEAGQVCGFQRQDDVASYGDRRRGGGVGGASLGVQHRHVCVTG